MAKKPHPFAKKMADAKAKKGTAKKTPATPAIKKARERVARLEAAETKKRAIAAARKQIDAGKAALAKAKAAK